MTRTPLIATAAATLAVLLLAWYGQLRGLATTTSLLMLTIFSLVNLSLWRIKGREPAPPGAYRFPRALPLDGFLLSAAFVVRELLAVVG